MDQVDIIIYLTRDIFCMADDVMAPNMYRYTWTDCDPSPEVDLFYIIEDYLGPNLPGFCWRGYAGGKMIVDVNLHRENLTFSREIVLVENWQELLRESQIIHFRHRQSADKESLPFTIDDNYYTFEEAEKLISEYGINIVVDRSSKS